MIPVPNVPGLFSAEVTLLGNDGSMFQIFRNRDYDQAIFPEYPGADADAAVFGPDEQIGHYWQLPGGRGDVFKVDFQRSVEEGKDSMKVSWEFLRTAELKDTRSWLAGRPHFYISGTWDGHSAVHRMHDYGEYYQFYVQLGEAQKESFPDLPERQPENVHPPRQKGRKSTRGLGHHGPGPPLRWPHVEHWQARG